MTTVTEDIITRIAPDMGGKYRIIVALDGGEGLLLKYKESPELTTVQVSVDNYEIWKGGVADRQKQETVSGIIRDVGDANISSILLDQSVLEEMTTAAESTLYNGDL